jgi:hypothetical protein
MGCRRKFIAVDLPGFAETRHSLVQFLLAFSQMRFAGGR